ncbi:glycoside hydrolase family 3 protein [Myceligenerans indicum]|uniref:beta-N-acetylhexosaminidase n=1 Tax=Myceligenerans indicum TaxID=2593663 RepID=A0ABS1LIP5_9MICO|nr:glycoside hydrolase family 3 protein [Myceligenerans indicum]MBL0886106.1 glycoside hydrolase family 3 protein [Myceligenerans indicum]
MISRLASLLTVLILLTTAGCGQAGTPRTSTPPEPGGTASSGTTTGSGPATGSPSPLPSNSPDQAPPSPSAGPPGLPIDDLLDHMSLVEKVGQIIMVGVPVAGEREESAAAIREHHVANIFLHGRTQAGQGPVRRLVDDFRKVGAVANPRDPLMLVATDQEGGAVQVLRGEGFSDIPSAVDQAAMPPADLRRSAETWGTELARAGVNLNLAPVADVVPADSASSNAPIGAYRRNYGYTLDSVVSGSVAFGQGQRDAGVATTPKHFPGLGLVVGNTDTTAGVTDTETGPDARSVEAFAANVDSGSEFVMMSSAIYTKIDATRPAVFSPAAVDLLRDDLGFDGVIMTDDLSAAAQVQAWTPGDRAVLAVEAGVDLVLASADPATAAPMAQALVDRAEQDPDFAARVDRAAGRVLSAKAALSR